MVNRKGLVWFLLLYICVNTWVHEECGKILWKHWSTSGYTAQFFVRATGFKQQLWYFVKLFSLIFDTYRSESEREQSNKWENQGREGMGKEQ